MDHYIPQKNVSPRVSWIAHANEELWEYDKERFEAPFLLLDRFDMYWNEIVGIYFLMHVINYK